jgi:Fe-S cluster assembly scaffold protein SufB
MNNLNQVGSIYLNGTVDVAVDIDNSYIKIHIVNNKNKELIEGCHFQYNSRKLNKDLKNDIRKYLIQATSSESYVNVIMHNIIEQLKK